MKNLTDYFKSPQKKAENGLHPKDSANARVEDVQEKKENSNSNSALTSGCVKTVQHSIQEAISDTKTQKKCKHSRKKKRKPSDPVVTSISELMSTGLSIVSPDKPTKSTGLPADITLSSSKSTIPGKKSRERNDNLPKDVGRQTERNSYSSGSVKRDDSAEEFEPFAATTSKCLAVTFTFMNSLKELITYYKLIYLV